MRVLIFALLCLVSFGSVKEQNQRLKKTNSALRQALRSLTVEQDHETAIGEEKFWTRRVGETMMIDGDKITVTVLGVTGSVRLGINGPKEISVHRMEIYYPDQETAVGMLIMNRNVGESIMIGNEGSVIKVTVNGVKGDQVRLAIDAPEGVSVYREEDWMRVQAEDGNNGLMAGRETKIGADKHGSKHGRETKIGADKHGSKHESEVGHMGIENMQTGSYYGEWSQAKSKTESEVGHMGIENMQTGSYYDEWSQAKSKTGGD